MAAGRQIFTARWVNEQHKEKSRYVVKDFPNTRDRTMFAAASDTAVGRVVKFKAVSQNYSMFTFDVTSAYTHAWEDELAFLGSATGGDRGTWCLRVDVDQSDPWASQGCKIVAGAL